MLLLEIDVTRLGLYLLTFAGKLGRDDELAKSFTDDLPPKFAGATLKYGISLWSLSCWQRGRGLTSHFNQREEVVHMCVGHLQFLGGGSTTPYHLRASSAGSTIPLQSIEAVRSSNAHLRICKTKMDGMLSQRVTGAAQAVYLTERTRRFAEVLRATEVQQLEDICVRDTLLQHRVIAGHLLFCLTAAALRHDSKYVESLQLTKAFPLTLLQAKTPSHRSSITKEQQKELLPFTALGQLSDEDSWAESWMVPHRLAGCERWYHFRCSWLEHKNDEADSRMSTFDVIGGLREFLEPTEGATRAACLTLHGFEATMFSWVAKSLLFAPDKQLALGQHVGAHYESALIYSRNNQIGLRTQIYDVLEKNKDGSFKPYGNRVQRLLQLTMDHARKVQAEDSDASSASSTGASIIATSDEEHAEPEHSIFRCLAATHLDRDQCFITSRSQVIHLEVFGQHRFWCGRIASSAFRRATRENLNKAEAVTCASCSGAFLSQPSGQT